jgi:hypothetical protein
VPYPEQRRAVLRNLDGGDVDKVERFPLDAVLVGISGERFIALLLMSKPFRRAMEDEMELAMRRSWSSPRRRSDHLRFLANRVVQHQQFDYLQYYYLERSIW